MAPKTQNFFWPAGAGHSSQPSAKFRYAVVRVRSFFVEKNVIKIEIWNFAIPSQNCDPEQKQT